MPRNIRLSGGTGVLKPFTVPETWSSLTPLRRSPYPPHGIGARSDLRAGLRSARFVACRRDCSGVRLECRSLKVKRMVLPAGKQRSPSPLKAVVLQSGQIDVGHQACWWQVRLLSGLAGGGGATARSRPLGRGLGPPALARTQSCGCDRPEHHEQRPEARHDKPPFGVGRVSGDATIRQVRAAGKRRN
jgi:hypothetical protein